jgi:hypothetical protein
MSKKAAATVTIRKNMRAPKVTQYIRTGATWWAAPWPDGPVATTECVPAPSGKFP